MPYCNQSIKTLSSTDWNRSQKSIITISGAALAAGNFTGPARIFGNSRRASRKFGAAFKNEMALLKASFPCHVEPFGFAQDRLRRESLTVCLRSDEQFEIPHSVPNDMADLLEKR